MLSLFLVWLVCLVFGVVRIPGIAALIGIPGITDLTGVVVITGANGC